jgi:hypothetical protein
VTGDWAVFLWPLLVFFALGALGAGWQARNPVREIAARTRFTEQHPHASRWKAMPKWDTYRAQQDDPERFVRSARHRALFLAACAGAVTAALLLGA